ncbi:zinc-binding dehydrogenase [Candidatus Peregrinibacteria bacterium]|nr:zinc-binding dehydrogenase [Candidatus Peregrinibacteria bacterium]
MPAPNEPLEMREFDEPNLREGAALLHTTFSEVCGTDVHLHRGKLAGVPYPIIPGHVSVGILEKIRGRIKDVDGNIFQEGDQAAFLDVHGTCGSCRTCLVDKATTRCPERRVYGITFSAQDPDAPLGGWSEAIHLKAGTKLLRLPDGLDPETYIAGGCGLNTALHAVDRAEIRLGDSVVVLGVGPVGQSIIAFAGLSGAGQVLAVGDPENRRDFAKRMGASETCGLEIPPEDRAAWVRERTGGRGADVVIEAAGDPRAVSQALDMARDNGRVVISGQYTDNGDVIINPHEQINRKHLQVRGCWGSDFSHFHRAIGVMAGHHGRLPWREMAEKKFPLAQTPDALAAITRGEIVKAVICPNQ